MKQQDSVPLLGETTLQTGNAQKTDSSGQHNSITRCFANEHRRGKNKIMEEKITSEEVLPKQTARRTKQEKPQSEQIKAGGTPNRHKQ
ncbi:MAG: hypothetical protein ACOVSW_12610 [Candidatus Kapaibacteriota bacterium]